MLLALITAGLAATAWGLSDFIAGWCSRRLPVVIVLVWSKSAGMVVALIVAARHGGPVPDDFRLVFAVIAGLLGIPAMGLLYHAMRHGSLAVVAPVAAMSALVAVGWGLIRGEAFSAVGVLGVGAALIGVTLASWPVRDEERPVDRSAAQRWTPIACAVGAAVGLGWYFILLHEASAADPYWSTAIARITGGAGALVVGAAWFVRHKGRTEARTWSLWAVPDRRGGWLAVGWLAVGAVGVLDATADGAFVAASALGALGTASMLASMYPAVTVLLNAYVLRERMPRLHLCGVMAALLGVICLSA